MLSRLPTRAIRNIAFVALFVTALLTQTQRLAAVCTQSYYTCTGCYADCANLCQSGCGTPELSNSCEYVDQSLCGGCGVGSCQQHICYCQ